MTKCRSTRPCASRAMTSRWPASATGSIASAVSSRASRTTASRRRLSRFDRAAGQGVKLKRRLARAPHQKHLAVADNGRTDREIRTLRVGSLVGHALLSFHQPVDDFLRRERILFNGLAVDQSPSARDQRLQPADGVSRERCDGLRPTAGVVHRRPCRL